MIISDLRKIKERVYPARRTTKAFVGGSSAIQVKSFSMGYVSIEPHGGQVPWHNHSQEEVYLVLEGKGEMCLGDERQILIEGQAVYIPPNTYHQLTNREEKPLKMIYCCETGHVDHPQQEMEGTLPKAGVDVPPLPEGAAPQFTRKQ